MLYSAIHLHTFYRVKGIWLEEQKRAVPVEIVPVFAVLQVKKG
jgi:hypothetical protein